MFETRLWRGRRAIPQRNMRRPAAEAAHAKNSSIMTPEFEFPNSLIGRERSLFGNFISLFCSEKFPVPLRREFCCKSLESQRDCSAGAGQGANVQLNSL